MSDTSRPEAQQLSPSVQEGATDDVSALPWSIRAVLLPLADVLHWPRALSDPSPASGQGPADEEDAAVLHLLLYAAGGSQQAQHAANSLVQNYKANQRSAQAQALDSPALQSLPAEASQQADLQAVDLPASESRAEGRLRGSGGLLSSTADALVLRVLAQVRSEHRQHQGALAGAAWQQMLSRQPRGQCLRCVSGCPAIAGSQSRCGCCSADRVHGEDLVPVELR